MCIIPHHLSSAPHPQLFSQIAPSIFSGIICPSDIPHCLFSPIFHQSDKNVIPAAAAGRRMRDMWPLAKARLLVTTLSFLTPLPPSKSIALLFPTHWWWRSSLSSLPPKHNSLSSSSLQRFSRFVGSYTVTSPHVYWWSLSYLSNRKYSIIHQTAIPSRFTTATFDCSPTYSLTL